MEVRHFKNLKLGIFLIVVTNNYLAMHATDSSQVASALRLLFPLLIKSCWKVCWSPCLTSHWVQLFQYIGFFFSQILLKFLSLLIVYMEVERNSSDHAFIMKVFHWHNYIFLPLFSGAHFFPPTQLNPLVSHASCLSVAQYPVMIYPYSSVSGKAAKTQLNPPFRYYM